MTEQITNDFLAQFNSLNSSGILEKNKELQHENRQLHRLIDDSAALLLITSADSMFEFISTKFLDYFLPQFMAFIIHPPRENSILQYCYKNIGRVSDRIDDENYKSLHKYFDNGNNDNEFDRITEIIPLENFTQDFLDMKPLLVFPLKGIDGIYGFAIFSEKLTRNNYTSAEIDYITHMFSILSVMIQNDMHYKIYLTDPKTGLYTYDYFINKLEETTAIVGRYNHTAGLIMIDIDFFRKFNEKWGHLAGDKLLITISAAMSVVLRKEDCLCRFGGDEFAVLVPETDATSLMTLAERLREIVSKTEIKVNGQALSVTISLGACLITADENAKPKNLLDRAKKVLYFAKMNGRNCSVLFPDGLLRRAAVHLGISGIEIFAPKLTTIQTQQN